MEINFNSILGIFQIFIQFIAAWFSYRIYSFNRLAKAWLAVTFALVLMSFRRITALLIELKLMPTLSGWISYLDRLALPTLISILLFFGFLAMLRNFENFEIVEKKTISKVRRLRK